jgi:hypothetical protein
MGQIILENTTIDEVNALKVDLATRIAGEQPDTPKQWIEANAQGYLFAKGALVTLSDANAVWLGLELDTEVVSVFNPGPLRIWVSTDVGGAITDFPSIPVEPGLTVTIPLRTAGTSHTAPDNHQISLVAASDPTPDMVVSVMAAGNSVPA